MVGAYKISIRSKRVKYEFLVRRQITIISGNSATGKTTLVDMVRAYNNYGTDSGIALQCAKKCKVLEGADWEQRLADIDDCIIFIDEGNKFTGQPDFARKIRHSNNYYVLITRERLSNIPYSVNEIYGLKNSGKYERVTQTFNETYNLYDAFTTGMVRHPQMVITEDSNSGFQFFESVGRKRNFSCRHADGKSNIKKFITSDNTQNTLLVVDGAAFGPEMHDVTAKIKKFRNYTLYTPESFEWIILKSGLIPDPPGININKILESPQNYVETTQYFSWERYFSSLLRLATSGRSGLVYSKEQLPDAYKQEPAVKKILNVMDKIEFDDTGH